MASIQGGEAKPLTGTEPALAFTFTNAVSLILQARQQDAWISLSEGGLQTESTRFKLHKDDSPDPNVMTLTFIVPQSGTLFFASANAMTNANIVMWQI